MTRRLLLCMIGYLLFGSLATAAPIAIEKLPFDGNQLPKTLPLQGKPVTGARWVDSRGENILVLTETGAFASKASEEDGRDAELYGYHFVNRGGAWTQVWKIQDFVRDCAFDLYIGYLPDSLTITDLDADGIAETAFLYKLTCRSDVSPSGLKLLMHEGEQKYAIRGRMMLSEEFTTGEDSDKGEMQPDPAFAKAPASFKTYAIEQWQAHRIETSFDQL